jgi:periplasmic divalent cation tolerance protein
MDHDGTVVIFITTDSREGAHTVARALLEHRAAACVNIAPNITSLFWWQDKLETDQEHLLIVKTRASQLEEVVRLVKETHSYTVPEVIAMPVIGGNQEYLEWIGKELQPQAKDL